MERVLLDTSVLIDISADIEPAATSVRRILASGTQGCICAVILAEFFAGVHPQDRPRWERYFERLRFLPATTNTGIVAGRYRYDLQRRGLTLATADALIAAVAREYGAILLTETPRHFPMDDIEVRSFRA